MSRLYNSGYPKVMFDAQHRMTKGLGKLRLDCITKAGSRMLRPRCSMVPLMCKYHLRTKLTYQSAEQGVNTNSGENLGRAL